VGTNPTAGQRLPAAPRQVRLEFTDRIDPAFAKVRIAVGGAFSAADVQVRGEVVTARPPASAVQQSTDSRWTVAYRVVSEDGHPVAGTVRFVVAAAPDASASSTEEGEASSQATPSDEPSVASSSADAVTDSGNGLGTGQLISSGFIVVLALTTLVGATVWVARGRRQDRGR
jgi:methionine-rich copper-binding protein CopC